VTFKGLTLRNVLEIAGAGVEVAWEIELCNNVILDECTMYNTGGIAFRSLTSDTVTFINCDAYNACDSLQPTFPGSYGAGFNAAGTADTIGLVTFKGCRAWNCSDQGFSSPWGAETVFDSCWSFGGGQLNGDGHGFKTSLNFTSDTSLIHNAKRTFRNCLAFYNEHDGFTTNENDNVGYMMGYEVTYYNCIAYHVGRFGFVTYLDTDYSGTRTYKNNIAYANATNTYFLGTAGVKTNNSWNISPFPVSDADFLSVDSTGVTGARQADGSLPDLDFLKLASSSDLIDAGIDVGIDYNGAAPDLGPYEYEAQDPPVDPTLADVVTYHPYWLTPTMASSGGFVSDDGGADITAKGVCWNTTGTPDTGDSKTEDGTGDGAFTSTMTGLTQGTTYYVRAYATNEAGTAYGTQMTFRTQIIKHLNKVIKHLGKFIIIN
jgi:hypothetical protein